MSGIGLRRAGKPSPEAAVGLASSCDGSSAPGNGLFCKSQARRPGINVSATWPAVRATLRRKWQRFAPKSAALCTALSPHQRRAGYAKGPASPDVAGDELRFAPILIDQLRLDHQPPPWLGGLSLPGGSGGRRVCHLRQSGTPRYPRRPQVGVREHRGLRRRSNERDDLRRKRRRCQDLLSLRYAVGGALLQQGIDRRRSRNSNDAARGGDRDYADDGETTRHRQERLAQDPGGSRGQAGGGAGRLAGGGRWA